MKTILFLLAFIFTLSFTLRSNAEDLKQSPSESVLKEISDYNKLISEIQPEIFGRNQQLEDMVPFAEYQKTGYIVFSDENRYGSTRIKEKIVSNIPDDVKVIVYTQNQNPRYHEQLFNDYARFIDSDRLIVLKLNRGGRTSFWTRDNTPLAVTTKKDQTPYLVDAKYYYNFEPDATFSQLYGLNLINTPYFFEGGNFIANTKGDCIVVNRRRRYPFGTSDTAAIPDSVFLNNYGCTNLIRFEHLKGIGHSDEVTKFLTDKIVVTDTEEYVDTLKAHGFEVHLLPEPHRRFETYVNSLMINDVIYVPVFNESGDQRALDIYQKLLPEHTVIPVESSQLSTRGQGGIHCITMNYPNYPLKDLEVVFGGDVIRF